MTKQQAKSALKRAYAAFAGESMVFLIAYIAIVAGLPIIIDPSVFAPNSIQFGLSEWLVRVWGVDLFSGGLLSAYGLAAERPRIERAGLVLLGTGAGIFAFIVIGYTGWAALFPALTYVMLSWSSFARYFKLGKVLAGVALATELPTVVIRNYDEDHNQIGE